MIEVHQLPAVNALLNTTSGILLGCGYWFVRRARLHAHRACMLSACGVSVLFLISYCVYHYHAGSTRFTGTGLVRAIYFAILLSHIVLAAVIVPLVAVTLLRALRGRFDAHRRVARWTLPLWLYVSVTGVVVYVMLYHLYPAQM